MDTRPPSLGLVADRRIREAAVQAAPRLDVRGPLSTSMGTGSRTVERPAGAGLTRRERRIKAILLRELKTMQGGGKTWVSHMERKKLVETLDVDFIDRELVKMERRLRPRLWPMTALVLLTVAYPVIYIGGAFGEPLTWFTALEVVLGLAMPISFVTSWAMTRKATQRRLWIYQALRELSDAEDEGLHLDESVRLADLLIDRIVDAEDAAARAPLHRIRT